MRTSRSNSTLRAQSKKQQETTLEVFGGLCIHLAYAEFSLLQAIPRPANQEQGWAHILVSEHHLSERQVEHLLEVSSQEHEHCSNIARSYR